jgi:biopolymer transport protein ExbB
VVRNRREGLAAAQLRKLSPRPRDSFWHTRSFADGLKVAGPRRGRARFAAGRERRRAAAHHEQNKEDLHGALNVSDWIVSCMRRSIDDTIGSLQSGLSILASIGSTAPVRGSLRHRLGIYHALIGIGAPGQASIEKVAGPVGEALIMTALGLAVAVPAVLGYNALIRGNKVILANLNSFAHDLHAYLLTGTRVGKVAPALHLSRCRARGGPLTETADELRQQLRRRHTSMSEINMTPLVDVMLVLADHLHHHDPVINHSVKIDLPRAVNQPNQVKPETINIAIDNEGRFTGTRSDRRGDDEVAHRRGGAQSRNRSCTCAPIARRCTSGWRQ